MRLNRDVFKSLPQSLLKVSECKSSVISQEQNARSVGKWSKSSLKLNFIMSRGSKQDTEEISFRICLSSGITLLTSELSCNYTVYFTLV